MFWTGPTAYMYLQNTPSYSYASVATTHIQRDIFLQHKYKSQFWLEKKFCFRHNLNIYGWKDCSSMFIVGLQVLMKIFLIMPAGVRSLAQVWITSHPIQSWLHQKPCFSVKFNDSNYIFTVQHPTYSIAAFVEEQIIASVHFVLVISNATHELFREC